MNNNEMLFALQLRQAAIKEIEDVMPANMSDISRRQYVDDHLDGYMLDILEHVQRIAQTVRSHIGS